MILGIDPLYLILLIIGAVAIGLGAMGVAMWKMIQLLTQLVTIMTAIHVIMNKPSVHPDFTTNVIATVESKLAELRTADRSNIPGIVAQLVEATNTLQQVTTPMEAAPRQIIVRET